MDHIEGPWSLEEDDTLLNLFGKHAPNWSPINESIPGKSAKTCEFMWETVKQKLRTTISDTPFMKGTQVSSRLQSTLSDQARAQLKHMFRLFSSLTRDMARDNVSRPSGGTHSYSPDRSAPSGQAPYRHTNIYIPPPSFSDIDSTVMNFGHEVGGVSGNAPSISGVVRSNVSQPLGGMHSYSGEQSAPSISGMGRGTVSQPLEGMHPYNGEQSAPSISGMARGNVSQPLGGMHPYSAEHSAPSISGMARGNVSQPLGGMHPYSGEQSAPSISGMVKGNVSQPLGGMHPFSGEQSEPSRVAFNKQDSSPTMSESDDDFSDDSFYDDEFSESDN